MANEDLLIGLGIGLILTLIVYLAMRARIRHRIALVETEFRKLWAEQEGRIRQDAAKRSRYVLKLKIAEHLVPLMRGVFRYEPAYARFIGAPIDYLIFDGYSKAKDSNWDGSIEVILADVKTGDAKLNKTERKIKEAVEAGRVRWETIRVDF